MTTHQVRIEGIPVDDGGINVDMVARAMRRRPQALHCQTGIHNPTGLTLARSRRRGLADIVNTASLPVIEDCCSWDLTLSPLPSRTLVGFVEPHLYISCWTLSSMIGHKLGEFAPTRTFRGHVKEDKKSRRR